MATIEITIDGSQLGVTPIMVGGNATFIGTTRLDGKTVVVIGATFDETAERLAEIEEEDVAHMLGYFDAAALEERRIKCQEKERRDWEQAR